MKAYIRGEHEKKGHFNGHKYRLTIAMPVSNQVKTIRRCLDSLVPLLKAVPSELIITDTGSTDGTVEIAREYTDHIENFPWCDDMSAARNVGLKAAQGEWFMSIDDDEWFDDVNEIIEFFNSGECDSYGCASYIQRNYSDLDGKVYSDFNTPRIVRIVEGIHFEGRIHDTIIGRYNPIKMLQSYVNHYGFAYAQQEDQLKKFNRNIIGLLKDHEEFPNDLRYIYQIVKEYYSIDNCKKAIEWCLKALVVEKECPNKWRHSELTVLLIKCYFSDKQFKLALDTAERFLAEDKEIDTYHMDAYWQLGLASMELQQYEKAVQAWLTHLDIYQMFKAGKLDNEKLLLGGCDSIMPQTHQEILFNLTKCYIQLDKLDYAMLNFDKMDISLLDKELQEIIKIGFIIAGKSRQYERIMDLYERVRQINLEMQQMIFVREMEIYLKQNQEMRMDFINVFAQINIVDPYVLLNKLRLADINEENTKEQIEWFANNFTDWSAYYSDVLYYAMKSDMDISPFCNLIDVEDIKYYIVQLEDDHSDFSYIVRDYFSKHSYKDNLGLYWSICLCERVVILSKDIMDEQFITFFRAYIANVAAYARGIYRSELFTDENISALPRAYRFAYYMQFAFTSKEDNNEVEYIKNMKNALKNYPVMKHIIKKLSKYFEVQQNKYEQMNSEFADLADKVKSQIEQFLLQEKYEEAEQVLAELSELLPNDDDVKHYRIQIQAAQLRKGIGEIIPQ